MKSLFNKKAKKKAVKVTRISKTELLNIVGGAETLTESGGLKLTSERPTSFYHS